VASTIDFFGGIQNEGHYIFAPGIADPHPMTVRDNAPIVVSLNDYAEAGKGSHDHRLANTAFEVARKRRIGIGCQGPSNKHRHQYNRGDKNRCTANWCRIFDLAKSDRRIPVVEIQTPNNSGPRGCSSCGDQVGFGVTATGPLQTLGPFLIERGVTSFELYPFELRVANHEGWKLNSEFGKVYDNTLNQIATKAVDNALWNQCKEKDTLCKWDRQCNCGIIKNFLCLTDPTTTHKTCQPKPSATTPCKTKGEVCQSSDECCNNRVCPAVDAKVQKMNKKQKATVCEKPKKKKKRKR